MIKSIELKDFEIHEHLVLDDFSKGFNLIWGDSCSGKTSIMRAVSLVAANIFDPKSVRVGCKNCTVKITSDKGSVTVTRGDVNIWEIKENGKPDITLKNVGVKVVQEAVDVIGIGPVKIGENQMLVSIMDQLDGHFLIDEIDGKPASGSTRAEMIDGISGLLGVEQIVRATNVDILKIGKDIASLEKQIEELKLQQHDQKTLDEEKYVLDVGYRNLELHGKNIEARDIVESVRISIDSCENDIKTLNDSLNILPDTELVFRNEKLAKECIDSIVLALAQLKETDLYQNRKNSIQNDLNSLPNISSVDGILIKANECIDALISAYKLNYDIVSLLKTEKETKESISRCPDVSKIIERSSKCEQVISINRDVISLHNEYADLLQKYNNINKLVEDLNGFKLNTQEIEGAINIVNRIEMAVSLLNDYKTLKKNAKLLDDTIAEVEKDEFATRSEIAQLAASVSTCPVSLQPIGHLCTVHKG